MKPEEELYSKCFTLAYESCLVGIKDVTRQRVRDIVRSAVRSGLASGEHKAIFGYESMTKWELMDICLNS